MSSLYLDSELPELLNHTIYVGSLDRSSVVVDLGGHLGEFSRVVNREKGCRCYVVEATAENVARIEESDAIRKFHYAIAGANGPQVLHIAQARSHWGSIAPLAGASFGPSTVSVEGITLETFLRQIGVTHVDLLKVDIEGAEIAMFDSTSDATLRAISQLSVEFHDFMDPALGDAVRRILQRLRGLGFECIVFTRHFHGDVLCLNRARLRLPVWKRLSFRALKYARGARRLAARLRPGEPASRGA